MLRFFRYFLELVYPSRCPGCGKLIHTGGRFVVLAMSDTGMESPHDPVFLHRASVRMLYTD